MEVDFGQEGYATHFDGFMRHYLTVKTGDIANIGEVYDAFKQHARASHQCGVESLVAEIRDMRPITVRWLWARIRSGFEAGVPQFVS